MKKCIYIFNTTICHLNDEDKPEFLPIAQTDVKKALVFRTFWILLHVVTCLLIIAGNGRVLGWW